VSSGLNFAASTTTVACAVAKRTPLVPDHIVSMGLGGTNRIDENIQPLCYDDNRKKNSKIIDYRKGFRGRFETTASAVNH
jgi:5-methylcytosine-specific restriction endonuclease McrA